MLGRPAITQIQDHQPSFLRAVALRLVPLQDGLDVVSQHGSLAYAEHAELRQVAPFQACAVPDCDDPIVAGRPERGLHSHGAVWTQWRAEVLQHLRRPEPGSGDIQRGNLEHINTEPSRMTASCIARIQRISNFDGTPPTFRHSLSSFRRADILHGRRRIATGHSGLASRLRP